MVSVSFGAFYVYQEILTDTTETTPSIEITQTGPDFLEVESARGVLYDNDTSTLLTRQNSYTADGSHDETVDDFYIDMAFDYSGYYSYLQAKETASARYSSFVYFKFSFPKMTSNLMTQLVYSDSIFSLSDANGSSIAPSDQDYEDEDYGQELDAVVIDGNDEDGYDLTISYYFITNDSTYNSAIFTRNFSSDSGTWQLRCNFDLTSTSITFSVNNFSDVTLEIGLGETA